MKEGGPWKPNTGEGSISHKVSRAFDAQLPPIQASQRELVLAGRGWEGTSSATSRPGQLGQLSACESADLGCAPVSDGFLPLPNCWSLEVLS